jgi:hypothetical protein
MSFTVIENYEPEDHGWGRRRPVHAEATFATREG